MANVFNINNLSVNLSDRDILCNISLGINDGDKIGIIGTNGCGKSTLLKIIAGEFKEYSGDVIITRGKTISYLSQEDIVDNQQSILEYVSKGGHYLQEWDKESLSKRILFNLGINDLEQKINQLSGGQRKRVALARTLILKSDILILDEPTNHLDSQMIEWLEDYLKTYDGVLILVTHDRYFLDIVTNKIVEIDNGNLYEYKENYEGYLKLKCIRQDMELATQRKRDSLLRTELEWVMRGARARSTKQKSRLNRYEELSSIDRISEKQKVVLESASNRMGKKTIELKNIHMVYNNKTIINDFSYIFLKNDRIGIIGGNGTGKTTLLNIIDGIVNPDLGEVELGETIKIGYFSQHNDSMDMNKKIIDYITDIALYLPTKDGQISASQMLERFLFSPKQQYSTIEKLSGGEKRRLYLLKILMMAPNVLILDEPTNDLDIVTLSILEDYLDSFVGIVIVASHDRYFVDRVVNRVLVFGENGSISELMGGYTENRDKIIEISYKPILSNDKSEIKSEGKLENKSLEKHTDGMKPKTAKIKFSYNEQREYEAIDKNIEEVENIISKLNSEIEKSSTDFIKLNKLLADKKEKERELEDLMERWVYLNDLAIQIEEQRK